jgi:hypothetical protein
MQNMMAHVTGQYVTNGNVRSYMTRTFFAMLLTRIGTSTSAVPVMTNAEMLVQSRWSLLIAELK